jgi:phosphatidylinositol alpha-1,6-mannosyltransferase
LKTSNKALLITGDFPPIIGGISTFFYELCKKSQNIIVLTKKNRNEAEKPFDSAQEFKIQRIRTFHQSLQPFIFAINAFRIVKKEKIDKLICGQFLIPGFAGYLIRKLLKKPYYVHTYGPEFREHRFYTPLLKLILNNAAKVISISQFAKGRLIEKNIPHSKIEVLTPGVDIRRFNPHLNAEKIIQEHNLYDKKILLTASRLDVNKGIDKMIILMPEILRKYPNVVYIIVGKGPEEGYLKKLALKSSKENIIFAGEVSDETLPLYYASCDVFVLPTREVPSKGYVEGFGIVFLEASACGKPIVAGRAGGSAEAVADKTTGFVVDSKNDKELLSSVEKLLEDENLRDRMGSSGRMRVEKEFNWDIKREQFMNMVSQNQTVESK